MTGGGGLRTLQSNPAGCRALAAVAPATRGSVLTVKCERVRRTHPVAHAVAITDASFKSEVFESDQLVLVDFWAQWCEPCKALAPILEEVADGTKGLIKIAKLDVDSNPTTTANFGVQSIPTLILFKNGKPAARVVGLRSKQQLLETLAPHLI